MQVNQYSVNAKGLAQISEFLKENAVGAEKFADNQECLHAWARDAEYQLGEGNPAEIELSAIGSIHGRTQTFRISNEGLDCNPVEIEN
jgi:hypothetical protein